MVSWRDTLDFIMRCHFGSMPAEGSIFGLCMRSATIQQCEIFALIWISIDNVCKKQTKVTYRNCLTVKYYKCLFGKIMKIIFIYKMKSGKNGFDSHKHFLQLLFNS